MTQFDLIQASPITGLSLVICLGLVFGSFATALVYRVPRGLPWGSNKKTDDGSDGLRSACPKCGTKLGVKDLFPVFSWLISKGKCRHCKAEISRIYPATEIITLCAAIGVFFVFGVTLQSLIILFMLPFLVALAIIDWEHMILPNQLVFMTGILGLIYHLISVFTQPNPDLESVLLTYGGGAVLFAGIVWLLGIIMTKILKRDALGFGDVKFMAVAGLWLGAPLLGSFFILSGIIGIALSLAWKTITKEERFPFGPALIASFYLLLLLKASQMA